jgi:DNA-binding transcriptional regulator YdaS (Cro superfamily)
MYKLKLFLKTMNKEEQTKFAIDCGTTIKYLKKRINDNSSKLGEKICIEIESHSSGAVKVKDLRPDVNWSVIRRANK